MAQLGTDGQGRRVDLGPPTVERGHSGAAGTTGRPLPGLGRGRVLGSPRPRGPLRAGVRVELHPGRHRCNHCRAGRSLTFRARASVEPGRQLRRASSSSRGNRKKYVPFFCPPPLARALGVRGDRSARPYRHSTKQLDAACPGAAVGWSSTGGSKPVISTMQLPLSSGEPACFCHYASKPYVQRKFFGLASGEVWCARLCIP